MKAPPGQATVSRTGYVHHGVGRVLMLLLLALVLNAAGGIGERTRRQQSDPDGTRSASQERVLRLARASDPQTLDPARSQLAKDMLLLLLLHQPLLDLADGGGITNFAVRSWEASADARRFTFNLLPEVKFSNGRPVVAQDYAYALERILNPRTTSIFRSYLIGIRGATGFKAPGPEPKTQVASGVHGPGHASEQGHVAGIQTPDPATLIIELEQPDPTLPSLLATGLGMAVPREEVERPNWDYSRRPVGSGPYAVKEWIRGVRLILEPNLYYAGREPRHFDRIEISIGGDPSTHVIMFERGEIEIANIDAPSLPLPDHYRLTRHPRFRSCVERTAAPDIGYVSLNMGMPPLDNLKVRQALNLAINKPRCLNSADGRTEPATGLIPPCMPAYNPKLAGYPHDPVRAQKLLAQSGLQQPLKLTFWHSVHPDSKKEAQAIQADLRAVGIEVELKPVSHTELYDSLSSGGKVQMALTGWLCGMLDPKDVLGSLFDGRAITNRPLLNYPHYDNPEVNRLLDCAAVSLDPPTRHALYQKAEELIVRDAPVIFLNFNYNFAVRQPWLKGPLVDPIWRLRLDRVWIER